MVKIDEFQSVFRAAEREPLVYEMPPLGRVALVTDREHGNPDATREQVARFLPALAASDWTTVVVDDCETVDGVVRAVEAARPDLIVAFRHLGEAALVPQHSLGVYLDVLTQVLAQPVLVLPGTAADRRTLDGTAQSTMVVTDHIRGERRLIGYAAAVSPPGSRLWLCHVEDDAAFKRYIGIIGQIPELDTDLARDRIDKTLRHEAEEYLAAAVAGLKAAGLDLEIAPHITRGHRFGAFRDLVTDHQVDLLVVNTKDDEQLAMQGTAYALAVELDQTAQLLL